MAACAGPAIPTPIDGEPICKDFEVGAAHTKMSGSLQYPVQIQIKNGSTLVFKTILTGRRSEQDQPTRILLSDDNDTYTVEWSQCENERAARALESVGRETKGQAKYECGKSEVYKTEQLTTKKGDKASHALSFAAPPKTTCWQSTAVAEPPDAGAPDAAADSDAGSDAGVAAETPDAGAGDASAGDAGSTSGADAGAAGDGGTPDAGASKSK